MFFEISKISFLIRASPYASLFSNGSIGACSNEKDKESDYFAMGFRLYDPEIGRFLAIDPLLDVQPSQTPYHYCFNNPTSFTDPTGLYPEKEEGDKVQRMQIMIFRDDGYWAFFQYSANYHIKMFDDPYIGVYSYFCFGKGSDGGTVAGYRYTDVRTGISIFSETGINGIVTITDEYKKQVESNVNLNIGSNVENPEQVAKNFWAAFWEGQGTFTTVENQKFLTTANLTVNILQRDDYYIFSSELSKNCGYDFENPGNVLGWTSYGLDCNSILTFSEAIFVDEFYNFGYYQSHNIFFTPNALDLARVILHEFGHAYAFYKIGDSYPYFYKDYSENWAIWYMNETYCKPKGLVEESYYRNSFYFWNWGKTKNGYNP